MKTMYRFALALGWVGGGLLGFASTAIADSTASRALAALDCAAIGDTNAASALNPEDCKRGATAVARAAAEGRTEQAFTIWLGLLRRAGVSTGSDSTAPAALASTYVKAIERLVAGPPSLDGLLRTEPVKSFPGIIRWLPKLRTHAALVSEALMQGVERDTRTSLANRAEQVGRARLILFPKVTSGQADALTSLVRAVGDATQDATWAASARTLMDSGEPALQRVVSRAQALALESAMSRTNAALTASQWDAARSAATLVLALAPTTANPRESVDRVATRVETARTGLVDALNKAPDLAALTRIVKSIRAVENLPTVRAESRVSDPAFRALIMLSTQGTALSPEARNQQLVACADGRSPVALAGCRRAKVLIDAIAPPPPPPPPPPPTVAPPPPPTVAPPPPSRLNVAQAVREGKPLTAWLLLNFDPQVASAEKSAAQTAHGAALMQAVEQARWPVTVQGARDPIYQELASLLRGTAGPTVIGPASPSLGAPLTLALSALAVELGQTGDANPPILLRAALNPAWAACQQDVAQKVLSIDEVALASAEITKASEACDSLQRYSVSESTAPLKERPASGSAQVAVTLTAPSDTQAPVPVLLSATVDGKAGEPPAELRTRALQALANEIRAFNSRTLIARAETDAGRAAVGIRPRKLSVELETCARSVAILKFAEAPRERVEKIAAECLSKGQGDSP